MPDRSAKWVGPAAWQGRAWDMYDRVPFLGAAYNYQADQVARIPFFPALLQPGDANPVPLQKIVDGDFDAEDVIVPAGITETLNAVSDELLRMCRSKEGGLPETRRQLTLNLRVPGECYGVWQEEDDGSTFMSVRSTDELRYRGKDPSGRMLWEIVKPGDRRGIPLDPERTSVARIWRSHPRYKGQADSAMRRLLDPCEEFLLLSKGNRAILSSRIANAGILLIQSGLSFGSLDEVGDNDPSNVSPFVEVLASAMRQAIRDPSSTDATVPVVVEAETSGALSDAMHHLTLERPLREAELQRLAEIVTEIVRGMDVVPETVFGLGESANFATARVITAEAYNAYIDPLVLTEADALTSVWYRPGLLEMGYPASLVNQLVFWRDPSSIIAQPDMAKNAKDLLTLGKLSDASGRRAMGFTESDAPTEEEMAAFQERNTRPAMPAGDGPNSGDRELVAAATPLAIEVVSRDTQAQKRLDALGRRLGDIDRSLMTRLQVACDRSVERTLRTVGGKLRSKAQKVAALKPMLEGVAHPDVAAVLGRGTIATLDVDVDAEITVESFGDLRDDFDTWVAAGQKRAADAVLALAPEWKGREQLDERMDDDRRDGWTALALALVGLARSRVFNPVIEPGLGEFDATLSVPMGAIRDALSVAGGSPVAIVDDVPAGMVGTGPTIRDLVISAVRAELTGWVWETGDPAVPFPPHSDLDGVEFDSWSDERLQNTSGEWPYGSRWLPGDHNGCLCSAPLRYRESSVPIAAAGNALP